MYVVPIIYNCMGVCVWVYICKSCDILVENGNARNRMQVHLGIRKVIGRCWSTAMWETYFWIENVNYVDEHTATAESIFRNITGKLCTHMHKHNDDMRTITTIERVRLYAYIECISIRAKNIHAAGPTMNGSKRTDTVKTRVRETVCVCEWKRNMDREESSREGRQLQGARVSLQLTACIRPNRSEWRKWKRLDYFSENLLRFFFLWLALFLRSSIFWSAMQFASFFLYRPNLSHFPSTFLLRFLLFPLHCFLSNTIFPFIFAIFPVYLIPLHNFQFKHHSITWPCRFQPSDVNVCVCVPLLLMLKSIFVIRITFALANGYVYLSIFMQPTVFTVVEYWLNRKPQVHHLISFSSLPCLSIHPYISVSSSHY